MGGEYNAHLVEKYGGKSEYKCEEEGCGKVLLGTLSGFTSHMMLHDEDKKHFVCDVCQKQFPYDSFLKRHMPVHVQTKDFIYPSCTCGCTF